MQIRQHSGKLYALNRHQEDSMPCRQHLLDTDNAVCNFKCEGVVAVCSLLDVKCGEKCDNVTTYSGGVFKWCMAI